MSSENIDVYLNKPGTKVKEYHFKKYEAGTYVHYKEPCVSISKNGICFNTACRPYFQRKPYVILYFDEKTKAVGIMPTQEKHEKGYSVSTSSGSFSISAAKFIREHMKSYLKTGGPQRLFPIWDDKNKMFILDLKK